MVIFIQTKNTIFGVGEGEGERERERERERDVLYSFKKYHELQNFCVTRILTLIYIYIN